MPSAANVEIVAPRFGLGPACRTMLDALPGWFGIPEANDEYVEFVVGWMQQHRY